MHYDDDVTVVLTADDASSLNLYIYNYIERLFFLLKTWSMESIQLQDMLYSPTPASWLRCEYGGPRIDNSKNPHTMTLKSGVSSYRV